MKVMSEAEFQRKLKNAEHRNRYRDKSDWNAGFAPPGQDPWLGVRSAAEAIQAGIKTYDEKCLFEALDMLHTVTNQMNPKLQLQ